MRRLCSLWAAGLCLCLSLRAAPHCPRPPTPEGSAYPRPHASNRPTARGIADDVNATRRTVTSTRMTPTRPRAASTRLLAALLAHAAADSPADLAARYDAPACRDAMRRALDPSGAFDTSRWRAVSRNWVQQDGALFDTPRPALYVRNQKVASEMILSSGRTSPFGPRAKLLHAGRFPGPTKVAALRYDKPAALPDDAYLVFSIVGEPSRTALKGYPQPCRNLLREILFRRLHGISTSWPRRRRDAPPQKTSTE